MTVRELIEHFTQTNADPDATLFIETETHRLQLRNIIEDNRGIYLTSEE